MLLALVLLSVAILSRKGSKDFRLWLPLLPAIAPLVAWGWDLLRGEERKQWVRVALAWGVLAVALVLGQQTLRSRNTRKFAGFWRAIDQVAELDAARPRAEGAARPKVTSSYHWAVYLREPPELELIKLPYLLDDWATKMTPEQQAECIAMLDEVEWFVAHLPVLQNHPGLMAEVNARFQVERYLWDRATFEDIGPVFVLRRWDGDARAKRFFDVLEQGDPREYRRARGLVEPVLHMVRTHAFELEPDRDPHFEQIDFLGWDYEVVPGDDHGWITYHWYCATEILADYTLVDRLTTYDERNTWQNNHPPAYGVHPTKSTRPGGWQPGWIVRESWPVVAAADPYDWRAPWRPLGAAYRRGDLMPAWLWLDIATFAPLRDVPGGVRVTGRMEPARAGETEPVRRGELRRARRTPEGFVFSGDDLVRAGGRLLPVHASARRRDDGKPISD